MFDKILFDKSLFDRTISSMNSFYIIAKGNGKFEIKKIIGIKKSPQVHISGEGNVPKVKLINLYSHKNDIKIDGSGKITGFGNENRPKLLLVITPISDLILGTSNVSINRLGELNEYIIQLENIEFKPGDEITIDTNALQILFGTEEDVSAVTVDSTFFEMDPGINELTISTNLEENIDINVIAIWNNRWL